MDFRVIPLGFLVALGAVAAGCAAVGGSGTLIGGLLCLVTLALFCLFYELDFLGPKLPPARVARKTLVLAAWIVVGILWALAILAIARLLGRTA